MSWYGFPVYVSAAERRRMARAFAKNLEKTVGRKLAPVEPFAGRKMAASFWGDAWCANLESYAELRNRLDRGRSYARSGAILDLVAGDGNIRAFVAGSDLYRVEVACAALPAKRWTALTRALAGKIGSLLELLRGELSHQVMETVSRHEGGLFPSPRELSFECSCPDAGGGWMCKHVAATLYGFGRRLDAEPGLLFTLRRLDPAELVEAGAAHAVDVAAGAGGGRWRRIEGDLSKLFGVPIAERPRRYGATSSRRSGRRPASRSR